MESLEDRVLAYLKANQAAGLHDLTIAEQLDEDPVEVKAALEKLRVKKRITADERRIQMTHGVTTFDQIRIVENPDDA